MPFLLPIHIAAGSVGLVAGSIALFTLKGGYRHRRSGVVFVVAMVVMAGMAAAISLWPPINPGNVLQALLACYLTLSALLAVQSQDATRRRAGIGLMLVGFGIAASHATLGVLALSRGAIGGYTPPMSFIFGSIALGAAIGDARMLRAGELRGPKRIARHLWRMCFALFIASGSFFLGQADEFPAWLRIWPLLTVLALFPLAAMIYWLWRVRMRGSLRGLMTVDAMTASARRALSAERVEAPGHAGIRVG